MSLCSSFSPVHEIYPYEVPEWCQEYLKSPPRHGRLHLGNFPTPLHHFSLTKETNLQQRDSSSPLFERMIQKFQEWNITFLIKRDDMTGGVELGGNKVRKLEFLLADALNGNYDTVVTIGGEQSNHCRATASACRMVGLEPHLILRTARRPVNTGSSSNQQSHNHFVDSRQSPVGTARAASDPFINNSLGHSNWFGTVGNILFDRIVGAHIYTCTSSEYGRFGSSALLRYLSNYLSIQSNESRKIYEIPVGGSNGLGSWGYIDAVQEILTQLEPHRQKHNHGESSKLHVIFASGSGGTAAGISLGMILSHLYKQLPVPSLHAIGVCDDPNYFYQCIGRIAHEMGLLVPHITPLNTTDNTILNPEDFVRSYLTVYQGKGRGYAVSTREELDFITEFSIQFGVVLDPVYTGKALYNFVTQVLEAANAEETFRNSTVLFWHTGGALGLYDKVGALSEPLSLISPVSRLDIQE